MIVREWPANAAGARAFRIAQQRGQVVSAERCGDVVRVVLRGDVVRRPAQPTTTRLRQDHDKPRQLHPLRVRRGWEYRAAVGVALAGTVVVFVWLLVEAVRWSWERFTAWLSAHAAELVGAAVLLLFGAGLVLYGLGKIGVCCPGVHCPGCRHSS